MVGYLNLLLAPLQSKYACSWVKLKLIISVFQNTMNHIRLQRHILFFCAGAGGESARDSSHSPAVGDSSEAEGEALWRQDKGEISEHTKLTHTYAEPLVQCKTTGRYIPMKLQEVLCAMFNGHSLAGWVVGALDAWEIYSMSSSHHPVSCLVISCLWLCGTAWLWAGVGGPDEGGHGWQGDAGVQSEQIWGGGAGKVQHHQWTEGGEN